MDRRIHVCQDDTGQWFIVREKTDGTLELTTYGIASLDSALNEARHISDGVTQIKVEQATSDYVTHATPYEEPEPRVARG